MARNPSSSKISLGLPTRQRPSHDGRERQRGYDVASSWGLSTSFARPLNKAIREYDAARGRIAAFVSLRTPLYLRAIDHMESWVSATHRAVSNHLVSNSARERVPTRRC
jgi:hypothetical protein